MFFTSMKWLLGQRRCGLSIASICATPHLPDNAFLLFRHLSHDGFGKHAVRILQNPRWKRCGSCSGDNAVGLYNCKNVTKKPQESGEQPSGLHFELPWQRRQRNLREKASRPWPTLNRTRFSSSSAHRWRRQRHLEGATCHDTCGV